MKKEIEEIFKILLDYNCNPIMINYDSVGFSRTIYFTTPYCSCFIEWWKNISYLSIGDRYSNQIPFLDMNVCTTRCSNKLCIDFTTDNTFNNTVSIVLKKLDWQETK